MVPPQLHNQISIRHQVICTCQDSLCFELNQGWLVLLCPILSMHVPALCHCKSIAPRTLWQNCSKVCGIMCDLSNIGHV